MKFKEGITMKEKFLLTDEVCISDEDFKERKFLIEKFRKMPDDFFSKLRHFQPQIGCLNACRICSKLANSKIEFWSESRIRNVIAALKFSTPNKGFAKSLITYDRYEHRNGVIFPYLDNDIGNYKYLETFIKLVYVELGVTTRISTVGYSRYNLTLNDMHERINSLDGNGLGGVRLSFTPYEIGWECLSENFSRFDYIMDMANLLKIYRTYYENVGTGSRNMCVEIRYKPLVRIKDVNEIEILGHKVIYTSNYLWISKNKDVNMREAKIKDPYEHSILLTEDPEDFYTIDLYEDIQTIERLKKIAHKFIMGDLSIYPISKVYLMINYDGYYYSINPSITEDGNYGINIYPKTETRKHSGYIITERFLVNSIIEYKKTKNLLRLEKFENSTWEDVYEVIKICKNKARKYKKIGKTEKSDYIINEILPMINAYISALQIAGYKAKDFFDPEFSIDTGIICNLGRAIHEFQGLTSKENEPLTPVHERNYGMYNSKMSREGISWRLSCNYDNSIVIEKLNMFDTASEEGQVAERINIKLENKVDEIYTVNDLKTMYLVPGQRLK